MNKYNSESYAAEVHKPANRAVEGDMAIYLPTIAEMCVRSCLAMHRTGPFRMRVSLFDSRKSVLDCSTNQAISIEPTALIKSQPDCCVLTEAEETSLMFKRLFKKM